MLQSQTNVIIIIKILDEPNYEKSCLYALKKDPKNMQEVIKLKYTGKTKISHDTFIFHYNLPNKEMTLGLKIGEHIAIEY